MKAKQWFLIAVVGVLAAACHEKKQPYNIIVKKEKVSQPSKPQAMGDYNQDYHVEWLGKEYIVKVTFKADTSLPLVNDGTKKYYDNRITLKIEREDGSEFLHREFTKHDFANSVDASYLEKSALVGIVYDKTEDDNLVFAASVGSPDKSSDDYVPLVMKVSRMGAVSISRDSRLDTSAADESTDSDEI